MNRRSFMAAMLAAGTAPAFARAGSLMRIVPRGLLVLPPIRIAGEIVEFGGLDQVVTNVINGRIYTYTATFSIAAPDHEIARVWADGLEISRDKFAAADGVLRFKDFDLTEFGNRVPAIVFESQ